MREGERVTIDGRTYRVVGEVERTRDGERQVFAFDDADDRSVVLVGPPWRLWTAPHREGAQSPRTIDPGLPADRQ